MKAEKNILIAFILNLSFSIFEFIGGMFTNSVSIISDSIHDLSDSLSIGISYFLEKKSKKQPDENYTYGYARYSILGAIITTIILLFGSIFIIFNAIKRIFNPLVINYDGMIVFALVGFVLNFLAAYFTKDGNSLNQKSVNLHMLEDVLGWIVVLIGAIVMKFTNILIIDSIMSILVSIFILINAFKNFKSILELFLEKTPNDLSISEIKQHLLQIDSIKDIHHIHLWSIDGINNYATMHIVVEQKNSNIKNTIRKELKACGINHVTIEFENIDEKCLDPFCNIDSSIESVHHH